MLTGPPGAHAVLPAFHAVMEGRERENPTTLKVGED